MFLKILLKYERKKQSENSSHSWGQSRIIFEISMYIYSSAVHKAFQFCAWKWQCYNVGLCHEGSWCLQNSKLINLFKHDMEFTKTENQQDIADEAMAI